MLAGVPLTFALDLDPCAVGQEMQRTLRPAMRDVHGKGLLAATERAEVRHLPVKANQAKQALDEPASPWLLGPVAFPWLDLPQRHPEKDLHRQAGLDGSVAVDGLSPSLAGRLRRPRHGRIKPDGQRPTALQCLVICGPVQSLVGRSAHDFQLSRWIRKMNPSRDWCNRVTIHSSRFLIYAEAAALHNLINHISEPIINSQNSQWDIVHVRLTGSQQVVAKKQFLARLA